MSPKLLNILLVLITVVVYLGYLKPMYTGEPGQLWTPEKSIFVLKSEYAQYADALKGVSEVQAAADKVLKDYKAIDPEVLKKNAKMLPDSIDDIKLRNEVRAIANKSGVAISGVNVSEGVAVPGHPSLGSYSVTFSLKSNYDDFKTFIQNYEKNLRFYILENAKISRADKKTTDGTPATVIDDTGLLDMVVKFNVYYLK